MTTGLPRAFIIALFSTMVNAFRFSATSPTQCDNLNITWTGMCRHIYYDCSLTTLVGGQTPFQLLLAPVSSLRFLQGLVLTNSQAFGSPITFAIPNSAFNNNQGFWSTQLTVAAGRKILLLMSDNTGIGGTSQLYTVGSSMSGASCNTTDHSLDFTFEANSALQQCR